MSNYNLNGSQIISINIEIPYHGTWIATNCHVDSNVIFNIGDKVTLNFLDKTMPAIIFETDVYQDYQQCTLVGGTGLMSIELESKNYNSISIGQIVIDIAKQTGNSVSSLCNKELMNIIVPRFSIVKMSASLMLEKLLESYSALWRILPDGSLWVGYEQYPIVDITQYEVLNKFPSDSKWEIYNDKTLLEPLNSLGGINIKETIYLIQDSELKVYLKYNNLGNDNQLALNNQDNQHLYNTTYRCKVISQKSDGSIDAIPDPANPLVKNGFTNVPIIYPLPGMSIKVSQGAICYIFFANNSPEYPRVIGWEDIGNSTSVEVIHTGNKPAARKDDPIKAGTLSFVPGTSGAQLLYNGSSVTAAVNIVGSITGGSGTVSIGG